MIFAKEGKMSKPTRATVKSFVKKNAEKLLICSKSRFDGMTDCVQQTGDKSFVKAKIVAFENCNTLS